MTIFRSIQMLCGRKRKGVVLASSFLYLTLFLIACFWGFVPDPAAATTLKTADPTAAGKLEEGKKLKKHLLVITSQPYVTDWFIGLDGAMRRKLFEFLSAESKISYEYIGSEVLTDSGYNRTFKELLKKKYAQIALDMVIAIMPTSNRFLLDHREDLFNGVPVIYVLPTKEQMALIARQRQSGVVKSGSNAIPATIERIRTLLPDTEQLVVVSGSGTDDLNYQKMAREYIERKGWPHKSEYLNGLSTGELTDKLAHLPQRTVVLMLVYLADKEGKPLTTVQVMKTVADKTTAPIFGFYDTIFGLGIVGGRLTSSEAYGDAIAETSLKLFQAAKDAPLVVTAAEPRDLYDWRQLKKWSIPESRLPAGSEVRYRQISFWEEYLTTIILIAAIIILQTVLIAALIFNLVRRKRAEGSLRLSEKKYRDIFDNAVMGIFQSTPEGKYQSANPALAQIFGYQTTEEMIASVHDIQQEIYAEPEERTRLKELFATQDAIRGFQIKYKRRDGSRFWISLNGKAIRDNEGNILYYEGTIEDITKQKQAEEELAKYREHLEELVKERTAELEIARFKAESADRIKSAFLATMSHELRTPLNSIIGFTGILLQRLVGPLNDEQIKQLNMVNNSAKHLLDLINDVLDISKIEAGQLKVLPESFELVSSVDKVVHSSQPLADKKGLQLTAKVDPAIGFIFSDRRRIEQILLNLISNAIKFTEKGHIEVECSAAGDKIIMSVRDTGIGIKKEDMGKLFNAFQQIESGLTRRYEGTGLGLSISKKMAEMLGGKIMVESEWGKGSKFIFILPKEGEKT